MWSGPRNISTAMMRSWDSRADCVVMDEPFYGAYLQTTGLRHPMHDQIIQAHPTDWRQIAADCSETDRATLVYQKHMSQHMIDGAPLDWLGALRHAFLIRPPAEVAASFQVKWDGMGAEDLGFHRQADLFDRVCDMTGTAPPVIEARDVLQDPPGMLRVLCQSLGVSYDPAMLIWTPGRRDTDGIWAEHWYGAVEQSTGFAPPTPAKPPREDLAPVIEACEPAYQRLKVHKLTPC